MTTIPFQVIAHEILRQNSARGRQTTTLQIIKLVYLAHGWNLAFFDEPLISDPVKAWRYGPVIPDLYHAVKHFRGSPIDFDFFSNVAKATRIPESQQQIMNEVMRVYGELDGLQLSTLTHKEGTPWAKTPPTNVISNEVIKEHFSEIMSSEDES